jgi:dTDP-4-dehydrorhamnose reductase
MSTGKMIHKHTNKRVLVLGANGMLGNAVLRLFAASSGCQVFGSVRSSAALRYLPSNLHPCVITGVDVENSESLTRLFAEVQPDVVINCVGLVKQLAAGDDPLAAIAINALLPHRLARLCEGAGARLVQMGTDCVFSGVKGRYTEVDVSDATDLYGRSKYLGEVDYPHAITLRTSIIGHELDGAHSLIGWFLAKTGSIKGYRQAIFSGLPTVEMARIIRDYVIPHPELHGVYHVSAAPINKFDLLTLVAQAYGKTIEICADDQLVIDRSLDSTRFQLATGYVAPAWPELIKLMHANK